MSGSWLATHWNVAGSAFLSATGIIPSDWPPMANDYDGDGDTDVAVHRPSEGVWYILGGSPNAVHWP